MTNAAPLHRAGASPPSSAGASGAATAAPRFLPIGRRSVILSVVEAHFQQFLHEHPTLTAKQTQFMNLLKNYIAQYGSIEIDKLYEAPFINISHDGIDGV